MYRTFNVFIAIRNVVDLAYMAVTRNTQGLVTQVPLGDQLIGSVTLSSCQVTHS